MEGQLLPRELAQTPQSDPNVGSAYKFVLILESDILRNDDGNVEQKKQNLMYCRIIGYLLKQLNYPPTQHLALKSICREIFKCQGDQNKLLDLGKWYFDHFIRACAFICLSRRLMRLIQLFQSDPTKEERLPRQAIHPAHLLTNWLI